MHEGQPKPEFDAQTMLFMAQLASGNGPKVISELRDLTRRTQAAMGKPWKESQAELQAIGKESDQSNVLVKTMLASNSESVSAKQFEMATLRTMLDAALTMMRPRERQLLWLAHAEGYSHREVAEVMGLGAASVRLLLFRARRKMARLMQEGAA